MGITYAWGAYKPDSSSGGPMKGVFGYAKIVRTGH